MILYLCEFREGMLPGARMNRSRFSDTIITKH